MSAGLAFVVVCFLYSVAPYSAGAEDPDIHSAARDEARRAVLVKDYRKAAKVFAALAEQGDTEAQYQMGVLCQTGRGVSRDYQKAFDWFLRAAEAGHLKAQYSLGAMYENGWGTPPDASQAAGWYERAARRGHGQALAKVGKAKDSGLLIPRNRDLSRDELLLSAAGGDGNEVVQILAAGADINARDRFGRTPLMEAIDRDRTDTARLLIQKGADIKIFNSDGDNALLLAAQKGNGDVVKELLKAGADVDAVDRQGLTPLMLAVQRRDAAMVNLFVEADANLQKINSVGQDALRMALAKGYDDIAGILIDTGKVALPSKEKNAATLERTIKKLQNVQSDPEETPFAQWTPLMLASWRGQTDMVELLLSQGADVDAAGEDGHSALSRAAQSGHLRIVEMLLNAGASAVPDSDSGTKISPLISAVESGHEDIVRRLVREYDHSGTSVGWLHQALSIAIERGSGAVAKALLETGVPWEIKTAQISSSWLTAALRGDIDLLEILLARGGDVDAADHFGQTALMTAAQAGHHRLVEYLLRHHAQVDKQNQEGHTALALAARAGRPDGVALLLAAGGRTDLRSAYGNTPLMLAVDAGQKEIVRQLLERNAEVDLVNAAGHTALAIAVLKGDTGIAGILLEHGANPYLPVKVVRNAGKDMQALLKRHQSARKWFSKILKSNSQ